MSSPETPIHVLYIDPEPRFRADVSTALSAQFDAISVMTEATLREGWTHLDTAEPAIECVICEYDFEEGTGIEFLQRVRERHPEMPFVLFTNTESVALAREAIAHDVTEYLPKSRENSELRSVGERVLDAVETYRATIETERERERLAELTRAAADCLWVYDGAWEELRYISGYEAVWGRSVEALEEDPLDFLNAVHPDDRSFVRRKIEQTSDGEPIDIEYRIRNGEGETRWVWVRREPIVNENGEIDRVLGFTRDITERKTHEERSRRERALTDQALDTLGDLFYVIGTDGRLKRWNDEVGRRMDRADEPLAGIAVTELFPADERDRIEAAIDDALRTGSTTVEAEVVDETGRRACYEFTGSRLSDPDGEVIGVVGVGRDISTRKQRERELQETKELYEAVVEQSNDGIRIVQDGTVVFVDDRFATMVGRSKDALIGTAADAVVADEYKQLISEHHVSRTSGREPPSRYDVEIETAAGTRRTVELSVTSIQYNGAPASLSIVRDITDRKAREDELRRKERRFEAMFNDPNILVGLLTPEGDVLNINDTALAYTDSTVGEVIGMPFWETPWFSGDPEIQHEVRACIDRTASGEYVPFEFDLTKAVGSPLVVDGVFRPVTDADGTVTSILISDRDITDQRAHERELELRNRAIDEAPVGVVMIDPTREGNPITYVNDGFLEMTQYPEEDVLGREFLFLQGPLTEGASQEAFREAIRNREPLDREILNYRRDGTPFWNNVQLTPIFDDSDEIIQFIGFQTDITTRVEQERRTQLLQQTLRHNIRNDLNVVLGSLSILEEGTGNDAETIANARRAANRLLEVSETAREIESQIKKASFVPSEVDLESLLDEQFSSIRASYPNATIETEIDSGISVLAANPVSIAIGELLDNALRHSDEDSPTVFVRTETDREVLPPDETEREVATVHIEDPNPRISDLELTRLRGEDQSPVQHGTGLGLWLVHWMVTMSGGLISYEPLDPDGNRISITLLGALETNEVISRQPR